MAEENRDNRGGQRPEGREGQGRRHGRRHSGHGRDARPAGEGREARAATEGEARPAQAAGEAPAEAQQPHSEPQTCPLCGKPLYDLSTALSSDRETGVPAHFDCVLERVAASESLATGEKLVYLGSGAFGVVEFKDKSETSFTVKRRIQWEKEGEKKDWRKSLSSRISNL